MGRDNESMTCGCCEEDKQNGYYRTSPTILYMPKLDVRQFVEVFNVQREFSRNSDS